MERMLNLRKAIFYMFGEFSGDVLQPFRYADPDKNNRIRK